MKLSKSILAIINEEFETTDKKTVQEELLSITEEHVMSKTAYNLENTRMAILKLANGHLQSVIDYTVSAKIDFRNVITWAMTDDEL